MSVATNHLAIANQGKGNKLAVSVASGDLSTLRTADRATAIGAYVTVGTLADRADKAMTLIGARIVQVLDSEAKNGKASTAEIREATGRAISDSLPSKWRYAAKMYLDMEMPADDKVAAYLLSKTPKGYGKAIVDATGDLGLTAWLKSEHGANIPDATYAELFGEAKPKAIAPTVPAGDAPNTRENESSNGTDSTGDQHNGAARTPVAPAPVGNAAHLTAVLETLAKVTTPNGDDCAALFAVIREARALVASATEADRKAGQKLADRLAK